MKIKKLSAFIMAFLFLVLFSVSIGCSKENPMDPKSLMEKVRKAEETMGKTNPRKSIEDPLHEKYMATIEQCSQKYEVCLEKCAKENNSDKCNGKCEKALSLCEKDIPNDLKTMK